MSIWPVEVKIEQLGQIAGGTLVEHIGIEFVEIGDDYLKARMPVDRRTVQPFGVLHGGASVALAETLGSVAANICVAGQDRRCVGMEINANHVNPAFSGYVYGTARPVHLGKSTHIWEIRIADESERLICISRITLAVLEK